MKRSRSLVKYRNPGSPSSTGSTGLQVSGTTVVIGLALIILLIWFMTRNKAAAGSYQNAETWEITWSPDGLPTKVTIHRDARRS